MLQNNIFDIGANVAIDVTDDVKTLYFSEKKMFFLFVIKSLKKLKRAARAARCR